MNKSKIKLEVSGSPLDLIDMYDPMTIFLIKISNGLNWKFNEVFGWPPTMLVNLKINGLTLIWQTEVHLRGLNGITITYETKMKFINKLRDQIFNLALQLFVSGSVWMKIKYLSPRLGIIAVTDLRVVYTIITMRITYDTFITCYVTFLWCVYLV